MQSLQERELSNILCAFTSNPSANKCAWRICLHSKYSRLKSISTPDVSYNNSIGAMLLINPVKNTLLLGLDIALMRVRHFNVDVSKYKNNAIVDRLEIQKEMKELVDN